MSLVESPTRPLDGAWQLTEDDLDAIRLGAAILGTGGGGNPYLGWLRARRQLRAGRRIRVVSLGALEDGDLIIPTGGIGAPTVGIEKIERGDECLRAVESLEEHLGEPARAVIAAEIGGANALEPMIVAAQKDIPVVDADGMGRAFPEVQMVTFFIYGADPHPAALCDEKGNRVIFHESLSATWLERMARAVTIQMGSAAGFAGPPLRASQARAVAIPGTVRKAWALGRSVRRARQVGRDPLEAVLDQERGQELFRGKIVDVHRRTTTGFARGAIRLESLDGADAGSCEVSFQNENLVCRVGGEVRACVPDLICILDAERGVPISTEELRYGLRVAVLGLPAPEQLKSRQALEFVGPQAFGLDVEYRPLRPPASSGSPSGVEPPDQ